MAWSIFSDGGGKGSAVTWAKQLLAADNAPDTPATEQFIYDWEVSEGGGGKYNPLNQGPVPGHPELTTTGSQYGGGAADFASYSAGIQGAVDYLNMPNYTAVQAALKSGNAQAARSALIASPWAASHYGWGSAFSNEALPGQASALVGDTGSNGSGSNATGTANVIPASGGFFQEFLSPIIGGLFGLPDIIGLSPGDIGTGLKNLMVRGGLIVLGAVILIIGLVKLTSVDNRIANIVIGAKTGGMVGGGGGAPKSEGKENKEGNGK